MIERENKTKREDEQGVRCGGWSRKWTRRPGGAGAIQADYGFRKITFNNEAGLPRGVVGSSCPRKTIYNKRTGLCVFVQSNEQIIFKRRNENQTNKTTTTSALMQAEQQKLQQDSRPFNKSRTQARVLILRMILRIERT